MTITAIECDLDDFIHQIRADMCLLTRKIDAGLMEDAQAVAHQITDDIDCIERCCQQILTELMK